MSSGRPLGQAELQRKASRDGPPSREGVASDDIGAGHLPVTYDG